jgi:hypothetical protein
MTIFLKTKKVIATLIRLGDRHAASSSVVCDRGHGGILIPDVKRHMEKTRRCAAARMDLLETRKNACAVRAHTRDRRDRQRPVRSFASNLSIRQCLAKSPTPRSRRHWLCFAARLGLRARAPCRARVLYCEVKRKANPMCVALGTAACIA